MSTSWDTNHGELSDCSPLFLLCPELELEPDTEDKVVSVVIVLWPLLVDLKLRPDLPLWKDLVLPLRNRLLPLRVLLGIFQISSQ